MRILGWAAAGVMIVSSAFAADIITAAYDGIYTASAERNPALSGGSCEAIALGKVTISQGTLRSEASPTAGWLIGFITEDGHVKGSMARAGGPRRPLEGRLTGDTISAGFIEPDSMCAWQIVLKRAP